MFTQDTYLEQIELELKQTPTEYLPALLKLIHNFREGVCLENVEEGFEISWQQAMRGEYKSVDTLWDDIEV